MVSSDNKPVGSSMKTPTETTSTKTTSRFGVNSIALRDVFMSANALKLALGGISNDLMQISAQERIQSAKEQFKGALKGSLYKIAGAGAQAGYSIKSVKTTAAGGARLQPRDIGAQFGNGVDRNAVAAALGQKEMQFGHAANTGFSGLGEGLGSIDNNRAAISSAEADKTSTLQRNTSGTKDQVGGLLSGLAQLAALVVSWSRAVSGR